MDICQTFVIGASWDKELIKFWVKGQGHITVAEPPSSSAF